MPEPVRLAVGEPYPCPRCHTPHVIEQPYADRSTAERTHLYVVCRGDRYFVGQVKETPTTIR
jgi:hypothetical protein